MARFALSWKDSQGAAKNYVWDGSTITIGRGTTVDVQVDDPTVSALHGRLSMSGSDLRVEDLASRNGILVAGVRIASPEILKHGDQFQIGGVSVTVHIEGAAQRAIQVKPPPSPPKPAPAPIIPAGAPPPAIAPPQAVNPIPVGDPAWTYCPVCNNSKTGKLTAIAKSGAWSSASASLSAGYIHTAHGSIPTTHVTGTRGLSATFLAQLAAPPAQPIMKHTPGGIIIIVGGVCVGSCAGMIGLGADTNEAGQKVVFGAIGCLIGIIIVVLGVLQYRKDQAWAKDEFEQMHAQWQRAIAAHDRLFYCDRCDTVFDASTRQHRPSDVAYQLLG